MFVVLWLDDKGFAHTCRFCLSERYLYEGCKQRLLHREERERHRRKIQEDRLRPPSPPPIMHYSEHEAALLAEKLKEDNKFSEATAVLFTWIDRGEVNRRSANHFYSMIQSANSHVRRLMNEKAQHEEEMELAKEHFKNSLLAILTQWASQRSVARVLMRLTAGADTELYINGLSCLTSLSTKVEQITAVFTAATRQKAWDHFSKAQRKNIDIWRKQCEELRNAQNEEIMGIRREEEMEMSDEDLEENPCKKMRMEDTDEIKTFIQANFLSLSLPSCLRAVLSAQTCALREENDSLRWQLDAYRNEVELLKKEQGKIDVYLVFVYEGTTQPHMLLIAPAICFLLSPQQLLRLQEELKGKELELEQARDEQHYLEGEVLSLREKVGQTSWSYCQIICISICIIVLFEGKNNDYEEQCWESYFEAALLNAMESVDLTNHNSEGHEKISASELERLMVRLPNMFKQEFSGVGATLEKRWKFCGFEALKTV
ncbi:hypothetical protein cypCar_00009188 [Cyprinus carpio]|nr:hypothetical protein cypCar_00009188 [Cyprinus carpio]